MSCGGILEIRKEIMVDNKHIFMQQAIREASVGIGSNHGGPFGAVVVKDGKIVGVGHNEVLKNQDPTCHGEIMAIRDACRNLGTWNLSDCELYTTAYPCPMCAGAIQWSNIKKVYYGCDLDDTSDIGFTDDQFYDTPLRCEQVSHKACRDLFMAYLQGNPESYQP